MAKTRSMSRKQNDDDDASCRSKTCTPWSDPNRDVFLLVMLKLRFRDYCSYSGVCKSWRQLALYNKKRFMESIPPMSINISSDGNENMFCWLEDFEGRKLKTIHPKWFSGGRVCIGVTCGYLVYFTKETRNFQLVNPVTRKQLHFPDFPVNCYLCTVTRAILVFSASMSAFVFVVVCKIWFSIEGKGAWKHVSHTIDIIHLCAFKGRMYTISYYNLDDPVVHKRGRLCELRLNPEPKFSVLETRNPLPSECFCPRTFISSGGEKLCLIGWDDTLRELDVGEMKWVKPCEKTLHAFFCSESNKAAVAVNRELWADPRSRFALFRNTDNIEGIRLVTHQMWYFPHQCIDVDCIDN